MFFLTNVKQSSNKVRLSRNESQLAVTSHWPCSGWTPLPHASGSVCAAIDEWVKKQESKGRWCDDGPTHGSVVLGPDNFSIIFVLFVVVCVAFLSLGQTKKEFVLFFLCLCGSSAPSTPPAALLHPIIFCSQVCRLWVYSRILTAWSPVGSISCPSHSCIPASGCRQWCLLNSTVVARCRCHMKDSQLSPFPNPNKENDRSSMT